MNLWILVNLLFLSTLYVSCKKITFENFKVYNVLPDTEEKVKYLAELREENGYDFWTETFAVDTNVRLMVYPHVQDEFLKNSDKLGLNVTIAVPNLQELIDAQLKPAKATRNSGSFNWNQYHTLEEIHAWIDELALEYPDIVTVVVMGNSNERREIKGVKIDYKPDKRTDKPLTGMIEGGIHAREWISPATVTWIINEFLTSPNAEVRKLAQAFVWHIFPVVNPDGYSYTFTDNRLWRKNRNYNHFTNCTGNNDISNGIDLNRNFGFGWMYIGASQNPCSETYAGPNENSEPETRAIINYVLTLKENTNLMYYFAFHSYGQYTLIPYSHVSGVDKLQATNYGDLYEIASRGADKLEKLYGSIYRVGVSQEILYAVSGSSMDWAKGVADVPIAYLFELRDLGTYGFLLPPEQIIPNNEEIMACLLEMDKTTREIGYYSHYSSGSAVFSSVILVFTSLSLTILAY